MVLWIIRQSSNAASEAEQQRSTKIVSDNPRNCFTASTAWNFNPAAIEGAIRLAAWGLSQRRRAL